MLKKLGNLAYNPDELFFIHVDESMGQVEVMFKGGYSKTIPFAEITSQLTLEMVLDEKKLEEEKKAQQLEDKGL